MVDNAPIKLPMVFLQQKRLTTLSSIHFYLRILIIMCNEVGNEFNIPIFYEFISVDFRRVYHWGTKSFGSFIN